jgi:uncharacterized membrane protein YcaP (DUF421 family)
MNLRKALLAVLYALMAIGVASVLASVAIEPPAGVPQIVGVVIFCIWVSLLLGTKWLYLKVAHIGEH